MGIGKRQNFKGGKRQCGETGKQKKTDGSTLVGWDGTFSESTPKAPEKLRLNKANEGGKTKKTENKQKQDLQHSGTSAGEERGAAEIIMIEEARD